MGKKSNALVVILLLVFVLPSLVSASDLDASQVLRIGTVEGDVSTLNPHLATGGQDRMVVDMIYNGLIRYRPGSTTEFEPDLAKALPEPELVDGKQVWTFHLHEGIRVHPFPGYPEGYELTSEDVVYSFQRAADPNTSAFAGNYPDWIKFQALGPYTVQITLEKNLSPTLFFPKIADLEGGLILPKKAVESIENFGVNPVGTGPFQFQEYRPGRQIILTGFSDYFKGKPYLERVELNYMPEDSPREMGLRTGELDMVKLAFTQDAINRMHTYNLPVNIFGAGSTIVIYFNLKKEPLDSLAVRRAICYALDRRDNMAFYGEVATPIYAQSPGPEYMPGGLGEDDVQAAGFDYILGPDLEKAKALLAEAGYPDGFSLEVFSSTHRNYMPNYEIAQDQLRRIGIDIHINAVDHSSFHSITRDDLNPMIAYSAPRANLDMYLTQFWHSDSIVLYGKSPITNFTHYSRIDDLIEEARFEVDAERQAQLWQEAQKKMLEDAAFYPLVLLERVWSIRDYVDLGYELIASWAQYPPINEKTKILSR